MNLESFNETSHNLSTVFIFLFYRKLNTIDYSFMLIITIGGWIFASMWAVSYRFEQK
ncbi:hypothetical protein LEP1GSC193_0015 [Leptospira alstonii serovar Pingchang str. 80-412]|uniref:Uncharacterized protein n=2 Tax=Leptospira alstonii TaxID=28452 RepID=M6CU93_9LEPT|nr:hypothetical protein LEP1GSC194_2233 [Leptospira alstonii serovar Sichuan str. 79601]EQA80414.1 hypothetical protein LEP1GSC193_0015 [Leptospira alstonii serovar Pingchang str. 80-412]